MSSLPSSLDHTQAHQHDEAFQRSMAASPEPKSTAPNQFSRKSMMRNDPNYSNDSNNDRVGSSRESVRKLISRTVPASTDDNSYGNPKDTRQNECTHNDDDTAGDQTAQSVFEYQQSSSHSLVSIANTTPINTTATATIYRPPVRPMVELCEHLLNEIGKSIKVFKPSKSLSMLNSLSSESLREPRHQAEIDIVISGGGMKCYFMTGCHSILVQELNRRGVKIARVAGASAGAWSGMFMCTEMGTQTWLESYYGFRERQGCTMHEAYDDMWKTWVRATLPPDAYKKCNGRLFISITVFNDLGIPKNKIISEYTSNDDLYECCQASSTIPFVSERHGLRRFRGQLVADGSITNDLPIFRDRQRRQLVFQLGALDYSLKHIVSCSDDCIEVLVLRGALLMMQFLEGNKVTKAITWLDTDETDLDDSENLLDRNAVTRVTRNDLVGNLYTSLVENKYLFLGVCVVLRNIFGSNKYKIIPTEWWFGKVTPALYHAMKSAVIQSWDTLCHVISEVYKPQK